MDENAMSEGEAILTSMKKSTTVSERFGGFAMSHLTASILLAISFPLLLGALDVWDAPEWILPLIPILMMGIYFPMGVLAAFMEEWTTPKTTKEKVLAVMLPTAIAWIWVAIVLGSLHLEGKGAGDLLLAVVFISFFFAAPSSVFVLCAMPFLSFKGTWWDLGAVGLLAGVLPPLLFAWGSTWQSKRTEKKKDTET